MIMNICHYTGIEVHKIVVNVDILIETFTEMVIESTLFFKNASVQGTARIK